MKKRTRVKRIMNLWRLIVVFLFCFDLYFNYFRNFQSTSLPPVDDHDFMQRIGNEFGPTSLNL